MPQDDLENKSSAGQQVGSPPANKKFYLDAAEILLSMWFSFRGGRFL